MSESVRLRTRRDCLALAGSIAISLICRSSAAARPRGYPRSYTQLEEQAKREGQLVIYSAADVREVHELLHAFRATYPGIDLRYQHMVSTEVYDRYLRENAAGQPSADLLFNSAMDLQIKLVNDGYAQPYASPEKPYLPSWAVWKNEAYGVTAEPVVFAYNKKLMPHEDVPASHEELEQLLRNKPDLYAGKVATYDVERSSTGYLFFTQDQQISAPTWDLIRALGGARVKLYTSGEEMLRALSSGHHWLTYNTISSYALEWRAVADSAIDVVFPEDYALVMSRIAFISRNAHHPAAAKLFLDFLLSVRGQSLLAKRFMTPVRSDVAMQTPNASMASLRAIHVGPALLANLDTMRRSRIITRWRRAIEQP